MKKYVIGIDIGGTNTDGVVVNEQEALIASCKMATTHPIEQGFARVITALCTQASIQPEAIVRVCVGTTHATNALLQQLDLFKVGVIRIAGQHSTTIPTCYNWPPKLQTTLLAGSITVDGGVECDGTAISPLTTPQVQEAYAQLKAQGAQSIALISVFAPLNPAHELEAYTAIRGLDQTVPITMSHNIGGIGFIERENGTILNSALKKSMLNGFAGLQTVLSSLSITAPLALVQNNGTLMTLDKALEYPVLTIAAGPTNSFIGASKLARLSEAIIVDIGGTSTDVGIVTHSFPRRSTNSSEIAGVRLNFPMPDVISVALGGGSYVAGSEHNPTIGPLSVGKELLTRSRSWGGDQLTLTDVALSLGYITMSGSSLCPIERNYPQAVIEQVQQTVYNLCKRMQGAGPQVPILLVGGGAALIPQALWGSHVSVPAHAHVANAYGAALAELSSTVDTVVSLNDRAVALSELMERACSQVRAQGAVPESIRVVYQQVIPYHYIPGALARVIITAAGKQALTDSL